MIDQTKLPHVGGDLLFAFIMGVINAMICPFLEMMRRVSVFKLFCICVVLNFSAYGLLKIVPIGIRISTLTGYLLAAGIVSLGSFLVNCFELHQKRDSSAHLSE